jgi:hypothetical protein
MNVHADAHIAAKQPAVNAASEPAQLQVDKLSKKNRGIFGLIGDDEK